MIALSWPPTEVLALVLAAALAAELFLARLRRLERRDDEAAARRRIRAELAARDRREAAARCRQIHDRGDR